ncbi:MAG TPA: hypothetical protein VG347_05720 [Verrucomicrobiae bacterium]|nr:hypothetical protein [Verrucomicrobiae bacterium]
MDIVMKTNSTIQGAAEECKTGKSFRVNPGKSGHYFFTVKTAEYEERPMKVQIAGWNQAGFRLKNRLTLFLRKMMIYGCHTEDAEGTNFAVEGYRRSIGVFGAGPSPLHLKKGKASSSFPSGLVLEELSLKESGRGRPHSKTLRVGRAFWFKEAVGHFELATGNCPVET